MTFKSQRWVLGMGLGMGLTAAIGCGGDDPEQSPDPTSSSSSSSSGTNASSSGDAGTSGNAPSGGSSSSSSSGNPGTQPFTRALASVYASDTAAIAFTPDELDAAGALTWVLTTVPTGSAAVAPSGTPLGFRPDLPGAYTLTVTGTLGGQPRTGTLTLNVAEPQTLAFQVTSSNEGAQLKYGIRAGGAIVGPSHDVGCVRDTPSAAATESSNASSAYLGIATWYGPPGTEPRVVFTDSPPGGNDGGAMGALVAATSSSTCDGAAAAKTIVPLGNSVPHNQVFNADGSRVAYTAGTADARTLYTAPFDGSAAPFTLGAMPDSVGRPAWLPDGTLASLVAQNASFSIQVFADKTVLPGTLPAAWMTCAGTLDFLPGLLFLDATHVIVQATLGGVLGIRVLHPNPDTRVCEVDHELALTAGGFAPTAAFNLSPSKTKLVFNASDANGRHVWIVPVDGSSPAVQLNTPFAQAADAGFDALEANSAPTWLGSDALLGWSNGTSVVTARTDGTELAAGIESRVVETTAVANTRFISSSALGSCSVGLVGASGGGGALLCALGLLVTRRRKRHG